MNEDMHDHFAIPINQNSNIHHFYPNWCKSVNIYFHIIACIYKSSTLDSAIWTKVNHTGVGARGPLQKD